MPRFQSLKEFYPFYLKEHSNRICRRLHFIGSWLVLLLLVLAIVVDWRFVLAAPLAGYGFAWTGHFHFEKNKPATFKYPLYSFLSDWLMFRDILRGRLTV